MKSELEIIPGIGSSLAEDLQSIGIKTISDLKDKSPEKLYNKLCDKHHAKIDRCVLYAFRCAVYYSSHTKHDPEKLNWWNWKDETYKKR